VGGVFLKNLPEKAGVHNLDGGANNKGAII